MCSRVSTVWLCAHFACFRGTPKGRQLSFARGRAHRYSSPKEKPCGIRKILRHTPVTLAIPAFPVCTFASRRRSQVMAQRKVDSCSAGALEWPCNQSKSTLLPFGSQLLPIFTKGATCEPLFLGLQGQLRRMVPNFCPFLLKAPQVNLCFWVFKGN